MLLIDSGNSVIKCRVIDQNEIVDRAFKLVDGYEMDQFARYLNSLKVQKIYLASVASETIQQQIRSQIAQNSTAEFHQLTTLAELGGIKNGYQDYHQLGIDRWLTLIAAADITRNDVIIVDAGSAITIDLLSQTKGHLGGAIVPGFATSRDRFRQIFPSVDFSHPEIRQTKLPGRSTRSCIHWVTDPVTSEKIAGIIENWQGLLCEPVELLLCGQDADRLSEKLQPGYRIIPDLVFKGMLKQIECLG